MGLNKAELFGSNEYGQVISSPTRPNVAPGQSKEDDVHVVKILTCKKINEE